MSAIILFRSLTHAQRGVRALGAGGVPATLIKAPAGLSDRGCAYGAGVTSRQIAYAVKLLNDQNFPHGKVFLADEDGIYKEVAM